jgi:hypothetical protein
LKRKDALLAVWVHKSKVPIVHAFGINEAMLNRETMILIVIELLLVRMKKQYSQKTKRILSLVQHVNKKDILLNDTKKHFTTNALQIV